MKKIILISFIIIFGFALNSNAQNNSKGKFLGNLNNKKSDYESISNPYGQYGNKYSSDSVKNQFGQYGSKHSDKSINNPYAQNAPKIYDENGNYSGKLSRNKTDPESVNNPFSPYYKDKNPNWTKKTYSIYDSSISTPPQPQEIEPSVSPRRLYTPVIDYSVPQNDNVIGSSSGAMSAFAKTAENMRKIREENERRDAEREAYYSNYTPAPAPKNTDIIVKMAQSQSEFILEALREVDCNGQISAKDIEDIAQKSLEDSNLTWAIKTGNLSAAKLYIKTSKKLLNLKNKLGQTPLMLAELYKTKEIYNLLIAAGADNRSSDNYGNDILDYQVMPIPDFIVLPK